MQWVHYFNRPSLLEGADESLDVVENCLLNFLDWLHL